MRYADALQKDQNAVFLLEGDKLYADVKGLRFHLETKEELYILNEVFVKGDYAFENNEEFVFIDIGMNVAITSLYFSAKPNCKKIYSFEPFEDTYKQALYNISLNEQGKKITAFNYGLGSSERTLEVDYLPEQKGSMGIGGVPGHVNHSLEFEKSAVANKGGTTVA